MSGKKECREGLSDADRLLIKLIQFDTSTGISPEKPAVDYVREILEAEGIRTETFARDEERPNLLAVIEGWAERERGASGRAGARRLDLGAGRSGYEG